jgi:hypothetical protein
MTKTKFSTWVGTSLLASSLLLLPVATPFAQTATPTPDTRPPETRYADTRADHDRTGLWGLLGLAACSGLRVSGGALILTAWAPTPTRVNGVERKEYCFSGYLKPWPSSGRVVAVFVHYSRIASWAEPR